MIGKLKGLVDEVDTDWVILDVQGVGYHVGCSSRTLMKMPAVGEAALLYIETHMRETEIRLYGFLDAAERDWFRLLLNVQGVGAKVALAILSTFALKELARAIATQDKTLVTRAPGVGPRVAQRIVSELKDKLPAASLEIAGMGDVVDFTGQAGLGVEKSDVADALSALINLGYSQSQATQAVAQARLSLGDSADAAHLIRGGLQELAR